MQTNTINKDFVSAYRLPLADKKGTHYFMPNEIIRLEANNVYTTLYFESHPPFIVSKVLKIYEELLKPYGFVRTHRSHLVNRQFIRHVSNDIITMQDASVAKISRNKRSDCMRQLKIT